jgi:hypothetical protein
MAMLLQYWQLEAALLQTRRDSGSVVRAMRQMYEQIAAAKQ